MLSANKVSQMKELITKIKEADTAYFVHDNPIITDKEYDALIDRLQSLEKETGIVFSVVLLVSTEFSVVLLSNVILFAEVGEVASFVHSLSVETLLVVLSSLATSLVVEFSV